MYTKFKKLEVQHQIIWSLVIATALVSIWRGIWGLMDKYIFPSDPVISSITTLILGIIIFAITHYKLK